MFRVLHVANLGSIHVGVEVLTAVTWYDLIVTSCASMRILGSSGRKYFPPCLASKRKPVRKNYYLHSCYCFSWFDV
jgi:hypothetical protein